MGRLIRLYAVLAKIETTYGVDAVPTGAANAMLVSNVQVKPLTANNVDRNLLRAYLGASEQLLGPAYKEISFDVELTGSGTAGTAPSWGPLMRACAMAETVIAVTRVDYTPISAAFEAVSMYCHKDGVLHKLLGSRGEWTINAMIGDIPKLSFRFQGIDGGDTAVANPSTTLSGFKTPQVVQDAFTPNFKLGGTVSPTGAPAITGGTDFGSKGITVGNNAAVSFSNLINLQEMDITDRPFGGKIVLDQTAAQEVSRLTDVRNATLSSLSMEHGTVAGQKVLIHTPQMQVFNPADEDYNGRLLNGYDIRLVPTSAGNDEFRLVTSY